MPHTLAIFYVDKERLSYKLPTPTQNSALGSLWSFQSTKPLFYMVQQCPIARTIAGVVPSLRLAVACRATRARVGVENGVEHNLSTYDHTRNDWTRVRWSRVWCKRPTIVLAGTTKSKLFYLRQEAPGRSSSHQGEDPAIDSGFPFCGVVVGRCKNASNQIT